MSDSKEFDAQREYMVRDQIARRGIHDQRVLQAMRTVPRHLFIPEDQRYWAYSDGALRIDLGQTISQPYIVALMSQALQLSGHERVLEVGTGSGYQAAILGHLAAEIHSIERHPPLAKSAAALLMEQGLTNIRVHTGDGTLGLPDFAPYQGIMVTAAAPEVPSALLNQLDEGARLVIPVGGRFSQVLQVLQRRGKKFKKSTISPVAFVPLIGEEGWDEKKARRRF